MLSSSASAVQVEHTSRADKCSFLGGCDRSLQRLAGVDAKGQKTIWHDKRRCIAMYVIPWLQKAGDTVARATKAGVEMVCGPRRGSETENFQQPCVHC